MALKAVAITLVASTDTPLLVQGAGATQFTNITGNIQDPLPVQIINTSATATFVGGAGLTVGTGFPLVQNVPMVLNLYGNTEIPHAISAGTPTINVIVGRQ